MRIATRPRRVARWERVSWEFLDLTGAAQQAAVDVEVSIRIIGGHRARFHAFSGLDDGRDHVAIGLGGETRGEHRDDAGSAPLVRIHSECLTGDVFGSARCDCRAQLHDAIERIAREGGYILYLRQEGRGIGLNAKLHAYRLQDAGYDTYEANEALGFPADMRSYGVAAQMLRALAAERVRLLTNNPDKVRGLVENGIEVVERVATSVHATAENRRYLSTKKRKGQHSIALEEPGEPSDDAAVRKTPATEGTR